MTYHHCRKRGRRKSRLHYCKACHWRSRPPEPISSVAYFFLASKVPAARDLVEQSFLLSDGGRCMHRLRRGSSGIFLPLPGGPKPSSVNSDSSFVEHDHSAYHDTEIPYIGAVRPSGAQQNFWSVAVVDLDWVNEWLFFVPSLSQTKVCYFWAYFQ